MTFNSRAPRRVTNQLALLDLWGETEAPINVEVTVTYVGGEEYEIYAVNYTRRFDIEGQNKGNIAAFQDWAADEVMDEYCAAYPA